MSVLSCRIWKSFWGLLDILMTIMSWSYIVCLMLRVHIAEDVMWQLRVAYFQKYVNLKGLTTWDDVSDEFCHSETCTNCCQKCTRIPSV